MKLLLSFMPISICIISTPLTIGRDIECIIDWINGKRTKMQIKFELTRLNPCSMTLDTLQFRYTIKKIYNISKFDLYKHQIKNYRLRIKGFNLSHFTSAVPWKKYHGRSINFTFCKFEVILHLQKNRPHYISTWQMKMRDILLSKPQFNWSYTQLKTRTPFVLD